MIIIGEKINGTLSKAKEIIQTRNERQLVEMVERQDQAGATHIDVNVATGSGIPEDEIAAMKWAVHIVQQATRKPVCIDSADVRVLAAGLETAEGAVLINSTTAEKDKMDPVLALAKAHAAPFIALAMDDDGIPATVEGRLSACRQIAEACGREGIPLNQVYFDPLVLPLSTDARQGQVTLETLSAIKVEFPEALTAMGLSNISYGLPQRININTAFLHMAIQAGLDAAILDPTNEKMMGAVRTAGAILGKDRHFRKYLRMFR